MKGKNCPNCGAPYDMSLNKCPYCGTSYYDLSALDFTKCEPFYLKIKTEINGAPCYITQLVRPMANLSMTLSADTVDCCDCFGNILTTFNSSQTLTTDISFQAVTPNSGKSLMTIEVAE